MSHARVIIPRPAILALLAALLLLAGCQAPRLVVTVLPGGTPGPSPTRLPTPCAGARVSGKVCTAGVDVYLSSCCPEWVGVTTSDGSGAFAFESLTAGTYTVTAGLRSRQVILRQCDSQASVDLCPGSVP